MTIPVRAGMPDRSMVIRTKKRPQRCTPGRSVGRRVLPRREVRVEPGEIPRHLGLAVKQDLQAVLLVRVYDELGRHAEVLTERTVEGPRVRRRHPRVVGADVDQGRRRDRSGRAAGTRPPARGSRAAARRFARRSSGPPALLGYGLRHVGVDVGDVNAFVRRFRWHKKYYEITEDLADDGFEIAVTMPGAIVGHNGARIEEGAIIWEFTGEMLRDREIELMVTSHVP